LAELQAAKIMNGVASAMGGYAPRQHVGQPSTHTEAVARAKGYDYVPATGMLANLGEPI